VQEKAMDIKVLDCSMMSLPPEAQQETYSVYTLQVRYGHFTWTIVRSFPQIEHFHMEASKLMKDAPKLPGKTVDDDTKAAMTEYFQTICEKEEIEELLQDRLVSTENAYSECARLETPSAFSGPLDLIDGKKIEPRWGLLKEDTLYIFKDRVFDDLQPHTLPRGSISLLNAHIVSTLNNDFEVQTPLRTYAFRAGSAEIKSRWIQLLEENMIHEESGANKRVLTAAQIGKLNELKEKLGAEYTSDPFYDDSNLTRYLVEHLWNVDAVKLLIINDKNWRRDFNVAGLKVNSVYETAKSGKCFYTGLRDKLGRPIVVFRAAKHDPNSDFLETLKLVVYVIERALEDLNGDVQDCVLVYDLRDWERKQTDNRTVKLLLEMVQAHYPARIGLLLVVSAPWYFRVVFKVIRPWLGQDLIQKVHIYGEVDEMGKWIAPDQRLPEWAGSADYDLNRWLQQRANLEGVDLAALAGNPALAEHPFGNDEIVARFSDCPAERTIQGAIQHGLLKKQAGWVKKLNKRYCVLKGSVLYYYASKKDARADGVVPLRGSTFVSDGLNFHIITAAGKDCVFAVEKKERDQWFNALQEQIVRLGGSVKEAAHNDQQEERDQFQVLNNKPWKNPGRPEVVAELLRAIKGIIEGHIADGKLDRNALLHSPAYQEWATATSELQKVNLGSLAAPARTAFLINLYNLLYIHAQLVVGNPTDAGARWNLFTTVCYKVSDLHWTLSDIYHGVLRCNVAPPSRLGWSKHFISKKDPRVKLCPKTVDPKIHFAICANTWVSNLDYIVDFNDLDSQLQVAGENFLKSTVTVEDNVIGLSPIFAWYSTDFGKTEEDILKFVLPYLDDGRKAAVQELLRSKNFVIKYGHYDWSTAGVARWLPNSSSGEFDD